MDVVGRLEQLRSEERKGFELLIEVVVDGEGVVDAGRREFDGRFGRLVEEVA